MNYKPKVTVAIPAYNAMEYLPETLKSVLNQTYPDFEVIIVNDGSTDNIVEWFTGIKDPRVKLISQINRGLAGARNTGIENARGEYIALVDADDVWESTKLEKQIRLLDDDDDLEVTYTWASLINEKGESIGKIHKTEIEGKIWEQLLERNPIKPSSVVLRRSCFDRVGLFDENLRSFVEDWDMWLRLAKLYSFRAVKEPLLYYRERSSSVSKNWDAMQKSYQIVIEKAFADAPAEIMPRKQISYSLAYIHLAFQAMQSQNPDLQTVIKFRNLAVTANPKLRHSWLNFRLGIAIAATHYLGLDVYQKLLVILQAMRGYLTNKERVGIKGIVESSK
jgi:glycosyltransferase involved in cell wall biosynthesis